MKRVVVVFYKFISNRIFLLFVFITILFSFLVSRLYALQILDDIPVVTQKIERANPVERVVLTAARGNIYDKFGRALAKNKIVYSIKVNNSVDLTNEELNDTLLNLVSLMDKNGEVIADTFPISTDSNPQFLFNGSSNKEERWKLDMGITKDNINITPSGMIIYLNNDLFKIPSNLKNEKYRKLLSLRTLLFQERYNKTTPILVASNVKQQTIVDLQEQREKYLGAYVDTEYLREYPYGEDVANMIGYIRSISEDELKMYPNGEYKNTDLIGKTGLEQAFEKDLRPQEGTMLVETDGKGTRLQTIGVKEAVPGNNVFLTLDAEFQKRVQGIVQKVLTDNLLYNLDPTEIKDYEKKITLEKFFSSMIMSNNISIEKIFSACPETMSYSIMQLLNSAFNNKNLNLKDINDTNSIKNAFATNIQTGKISIYQMIIVLKEQGNIKLTDGEILELKGGSITPLSLIKNKIQSGEITPQMTNLDPCTASATVLDVNTGEVEALVTYPTYDNNQFVNKFNSEYFNKLNNDPTAPFNNRPLTLRKAPGSTFKMVTAMAALETGAITPSTTIYDKGIFTDAGMPAARCLIYMRSGGSHGDVNLAHALEVSCNYFFYTTSFNLKNTNQNEGMTNIEVLDKYMSLFGLDKPSGIELHEADPMIASPENKVIVEKQKNLEATDSQIKWSEGDTIRTSIGQTYSNFTTTNIAKYIAMLASGGKRYETHLVNKIISSDGFRTNDIMPVLELDAKFKKENLQTIYDGMTLVTSGEHGSLRKVFAGTKFPVLVPGKSGTAQEGSTRPSHAWFVCFAPAEKPQIAVSVLVPFGESSLAPAAVIAREIVADYLGLNKSDVIISDNQIN